MPSKLCFIHLKKTDFCVNLSIPSEKAAVHATLTDSTVLMFETGINVKQAKALKVPELAAHHEARDHALHASKTTPASPCPKQWRKDAANSAPVRLAASK